MVTLFLCAEALKTATAVAYCKRGNGLLKVNGRPLENIEPLTLRYKTPVSTAGYARGKHGMVRGTARPPTVCG
ncbi:hypothetical protein IscW_ISCW023885 [Ixodes scapularis]|uniref:Uncharacterized protein n=1 Tax=Ixodes scapularis TaxID=6945 RepID=B7QNL7_IXOSC|nr:hypothetical protein IscW_ISCW023885 [Ixodes scapularis]|eukprot:XP_002416522.1 hypothetical protein IscW_ISCW023885 [Ixodes scapularis]